MDSLEIYKQTIRDLIDNGDFTKAMDLMTNRELMDKLIPLPKRYRYMITFTVDPKKPKTPVEDIYKYICKQFTERPPLKVEEAWIVQEGDGVDKHIHWHVYVETSVSLKKDRFQFYTKKFGKIDFSRHKSTNSDSALEYMSKEANPVQLV